MITQKQQEERQQRAQAAFPREEKQTATPIPPPSRLASASPRCWIDKLLRILGVAFADGFLFGWGVAPENMGYVLVLGMLMVLVGAFLLRFWWALLIVPVAFVVGNVLGKCGFPSYNVVGLLGRLRCKPRFIGRLRFCFSS